MTTAENIANLLANFKDHRTKEVLSNMSLDEIASTWSDIKAAHDTPAEDKAAQEKDFKEKSDILHEAVTPEKLQSKIEEYMEGLANGTYSPADFTIIAEFCDSFKEEFKNDAINNKLGEMKKRMEEKRLSMENPITLIGDKLPQSFSIPELDSIVIEGDKEKVSTLEDKTQPNNKTVSFKGAEDKDLGTVSFNEQGMADITFVNENNEKQHYQLSADGTLLYLPEGQEPQPVSEEMKQSKETIHALKLANSAKKTWADYSVGKLDSAVEKSITVKEGNNSTRFNEGQNKTTVDENKKNTKVDEGNEDEDPLSKTTINEEKSLEKQETDLDSGTPNDKPTPENELYWEEKDIIEAMFKEWFLKAANAVTNWIVHQIEYTVAGIWGELESAFQKRKAELEEAKKEAEKQDKTQELYGKVQDISEKHIKPLEKEGSKKATKTATDTVKSGNIDKAIADNKLLQNLGNYVDVKAVLTQGNPETTVPFVMGMASMATKFADDYAHASILDAQMNNPEAFKGQNMEEVYAAKQKEAQTILKQKMLAHQKENPNENPDKAMLNAINKCTEDMKKAKEVSIEDYNNKRYVENGKNPRRNEILESYEAILQQLPSRSGDREEEITPPAPEEHAPETHTHEETAPDRDPETHKPSEPSHVDNPTSLTDEAERQTTEDSRIQYIRDGLQMESATLDGRQQSNADRRHNLERTKNFVLNGIEAGQWHAPLQTPQHIEPQQPKPQITPPLRPQGRE